MDASEIIDTLGLVPHPEGGWFRESWRHERGPGGPDDRPFGTAIYFLLAAGDRSHWHRIDAPEIWHHYSGAPLELWTASDDGQQAELRVLGTDLEAGERPQLVVPAGWWQAANTRGDYTLVGCTVSPAFEFSAFELAPPEWQPGA